MAKLARWEPFRELDDIRTGFDRLLERISPSLYGEGMWMPAVDIKDTGENLVVKAEVPGFDKKDINISLTGDTITISGKMQEEKEEKKAQYLYRERVSGSFTRSFTLPVPVDREKVKATCKDGVLEIILPKAEEAKTKEIKVNVE
ncbi:MAG TPA: Hsp20/alpha crystallin family protein [Candidatus Ratteibacteria bacterium]|uniref:Spore protein SP21 n=1 Tax=candidate division TA06 bacterium ADurb.Bin131 TaxID=1852827 RepID=A0A1V6CC71_UNCT6|nr:MAG: Spore protein SP21 [candidate division TA06 bacterium ADurb.Bin131]HOC02214.1 Hsp20/alpha crystallin family protein [bacterium]HRS06469.1 Hsp20/alpha crystallin family protein [Candidatus Ratteibacteria bacterium]HON05245.1 Hsp20/alpha crystallin family protein [bacterium]HPC29074.1 Hsp20/alpha crystallin family protein [bacterium]